MGQTALSANGQTPPDKQPDKLKSGETETKNPDSESPISLGTRLVELNVKVADISGKGIADLHREDFSVFEDGVKQSISYFEPESAPFDLVLMLDFSSSTEDKSKLIKDAAAHFVDTLKANDRIAVIAFTDKFKLVSDFSNNHEELKKHINKIKAHGGTALYDSLWRVYDMLKTDKQERKAIVLMTDGVDESLDAPDEYPAEHPYEELLSRVTEEGASIYPIYLDTEHEEVDVERNSTHRTFEIARFRLAQLAEETGGLAFKAAQLEDLDKVYPLVAGELRTVYSIGYNPSNTVADGKMRKIRVEIDRPNAVARTRKGYVAK
ncbi:MAG TPA: VWA domain-containing protein [Blastocatellia bacterium]|nr:VWA domain-containing protein [Blastocatellia bacterium]